MVAALALFALLHQGDAATILGVNFVSGGLFCGIGYGLHRLFKKEYTAPATQSGNLLVVKDRKHDQILKEIKTRRVAALKRAVVVNRLVPPWNEVKKFKFLRDEGIISTDEFASYRESILPSAGANISQAAGTDKPVEPRVLH